jgi:putative heme transporter
VSGDGNAEVNLLPGTSPSGGPALRNTSGGTAGQTGQVRGRRAVGLSRALTVVLLLVAAVAAVLARHRLGQWWQELVGVRWQWVLVAAVVQLVSMQCLVLQQRVLLRAGGGRGAIRELTSISYASNGISMGLPLAGGAASAAYSYRRLHELGNGAALVGWVLSMSGVASTVALAATLALGSAVTGSSAGALGAFAATAVGAVPVVGAVLAVRHPGTRAFVVRLVGRGAALLGRVVPKVRRVEVERRVEEVLHSLGSFRLPARAGAASGLLALVNWLLDAACLGLAVVAVDAAVPWRGLLLAWAAGALASSVRLTPGGLGVVEAALASALVAAGLPASQAVPAAIVYRLVSLWLLAAIGAGCLLRSPHPAAHGNR